MFLGSLNFKFRPVGKNNSEPDWHFLAARCVGIVNDKEKGTFAVKKVDLFAPCQLYDQAQAMKGPGCKIYDVRPATCRDFPEKPEQILDTPCSFYFERTVDGSTERVGGKGSPHPGRTVANV